MLFAVRDYGEPRYQGEELVRVRMRGHLLVAIRVVPRSIFVPEALSASGTFLL